MTGTNTLNQRDEIIRGLYRRGYKLELVGESKGGKTQATIELALALATGGKFLDTFDCERSKVLYVNTELFEEDFSNRLEAVRHALNITPESYRDTLFVITLRGCGFSSVESILGATRTQDGNSFDLIIIDPIYKLLEDENNNSAVGKTLLTFDTYTKETGCGIVYVHHYPKANTNARSGGDKGSGAGAFRRDYDACITLDRLYTGANPDAYAYIENHAKQYTSLPVPVRFTFEARSFKEPRPVNTWFEFPIHNTINAEMLAECPLAGSEKSCKEKGGETTRKNALERWEHVTDLFRRVSEECKADGVPPTRENVFTRFCVAYESEFGFSIDAKTFSNWCAPNYDRCPVHFEGKGKDSRLVFDSETEVIERLNL